MVKLGLPTAFILGFSLVACGQGSFESSQNRQSLISRMAETESTSRHRSIEQSLTSEIAELGASPWAESCDAELAPIRQELAFALDDRAREIDLALETTPRSGFRYVQVGPAILSENVNPIERRS